MLALSSEANTKRLSNVMTELLISNLDFSFLGTKEHAQRLKKEILKKV